MYFVDVAQHHPFYTFMLEYFAHNAAISTPYHKDSFWIRVACEWEMGNHFLVAESTASTLISV